MDKTLRKVQIIGGIILFLLILIKPLRLVPVNAALIIVVSLLTLLLYFLAVYHLISKWKYSILLAILLLLMNFMEGAGLMAILFSLMFWPGQYSMVISALYFLGFSAVLIVIFYFFSNRKIIPFGNYVSERSNSNAGMDGSIDLSKPTAIVNLKVEWIKWISIFGMVLAFYFLPIEKRIAIFAADPAESSKRLAEKYYKEKAEYENYSGSHSDDD